MNKTLVDKTRCMLINSKLLRSFWAEAVRIPCYLVNRCPSSTTGCKTLEEKWSGRPGKYDNFKIFGCLAYAHINRGKIKPRTLKRVFVGYPDGIKDIKSGMDSLGNALSIEMLFSMKKL